MMSRDPLFAARHVHDMAGETNGRMAMVLTGLSVALVAIMAIREARELFGDKGYKQWEHHHQRHENHAGRSR